MKRDWNTHLYYSHQLKAHQSSSAYTFPALGYIYFIGGQMNRHFPQIASRTVTRLRCSDGSIERMQSLPSQALQHAVATSQGLIVVCGGILDGCPVSKCQVFSLNNER